MEYEVSMEDIVKDEVEFYAHTVLRPGILDKAWYKVGNCVEVGNYSHVWFRTSRDYGDKVEISERWDVWRINEPPIYLGKLPEAFQRAELGGVIPYVDIINRLTFGSYVYKYPGY